MSDELLSMFFDDDFVPHAYLDAVYAQVTPRGVNPWKDPKYIQQLQHRSSVLLSHLDHYTNGLTNELESQISKLHTANSIVSYSYEPTEQSKLKPTTRLEYYIDSLSISTNSLDDSIKSIEAKIHGLKFEAPETEKLLLLTHAKTNLLKVQKSLETVKSIVEITYDSNQPTVSKTRVAPTNTRSSMADICITPTELSSAVDILSETIIDQLNERQKTETEYEIDRGLLTRIEDFCALLPVFKNLGEFYTIYSEFAKKVQSEKESYLKTKALDDELSANVLG